ncbi:MAPEG family protein [Roseomonas sp. NAR14]|uniref:MAPEG family protein n=1 Tax=Roseomonas acroporae TaxID=2937791 RepID=A0A9X2BS88_9PROT|nr:MAPEG family protein [Roseomonas acroporae]MCK8782877.1 MAPEG family protein [Roseomonas acroporae]
MSTELSLLLASVVLGLIELLATGVAASAQLGIAYTAGPRDEERPLGPIGGRIRRAFANFMESFPFFAALVLAGAVLGRSNGWTVWGAHLYFWARLFYWPLYVLGVPMLRSLVWGVSLVGIVLLLVGVA